MDQAMSSEEASASCGCGCSTKPPRFGKAEVVLGLALLLALTAEAIALATGEEQTAAVLILSLAAILLGGIETFKRALASVASLTLNINFLMCLAVVGAFVIGSYPEAAMVIVLFAIAERIESFALDHARNAVRSLMTLAPETALAQREGAWAEVDAGTIQLGEVRRQNCLGWSGPQGQFFGQPGPHHRRERTPRQGSGRPRLCRNDQSGRPD